jgi:hypothetical protein
MQLSMVKMNKIEYMDRHHVSYNPPKIVLIPHQEHERIHGNIPKVDELNLKMRQYDKLVQLSVMLKNWLYSYQREFRTNPVNIGLEEVEIKKKEALKEIKRMVKNELPKVQHIKGLGVRYLAGLLAYAHPSRFPNVGRYLYYCGYTKASKINGRYNRKVCSLVHQVAKQLIIKKDPKYSPLYLKIKAEQPKQYTKIKKHRIALNRIATLFLKEFYSLFKNDKKL